MASIPETIEIGRLRDAFVALERDQSQESYARMAECAVRLLGDVDSDMRDALNKSLAPLLEELSLRANQGIVDSSIYHEVDVLLEFFYRWAHARFAFRQVAEMRRHLLGDPRIAVTEDGDEPF